MAKEKDTSCAQPSAGPIMADSEESETTTTVVKKEKKVLARVGQKAPDFEATAFADGGFTNVKLSDFDGQWRVLCFYPGDFTFV